MATENDTGRTASDNPSTLRYDLICLRQAVPCRQGR